MMNDEKTALLQLVEDSLDRIRPFLKADGGDIEIIEITDEMVLKVKLLGACSSCSLSYMTMKAGVEENIKKDIPLIQRVEAIEAEQTDAYEAIQSD